MVGRFINVIQVKVDDDTFTWFVTRAYDGKKKLSGFVREVLEKYRGDCVVEEKAAFNKKEQEGKDE